MPVAASEMLHTGPQLRVSYKLGCNCDSTNWLVAASLLNLLIAVTMLMWRMLDISSLIEKYALTVLWKND